MAKLGFCLATLAQGFTYESAFNKVATSTDPRGEFPSDTDTTQGQPLASFYALAAMRLTASAASMMSMP
jgi:hypothetical protein